MKNRIVASIMALAITASAAAVLPTSTASADWVQQSDGWHYYNEDGTQKTNEWHYDDLYRSWYYIDKDGREALGPELFTTPGVDTVVGYKKITQTAYLYGVNFKLTLDLADWEQKTTPQQVITLTDLFWNCYPKMYARFVKATKCPSEVTIKIQQNVYVMNNGVKQYVPAYALFDTVTLDDSQLKNSPRDYDFLTHELGHVINNIFYTYQCDYIDRDYVERVAEYFRYVYAYQGGSFNDDHWTLATSKYETARENSNRFLIWLDYRYSSDNKDIIFEFLKTWCNLEYKADNWDEAWAKIFAGTELEGMTIDEVWEEYRKDPFSKAVASANAKNPDNNSDLIQQYNVRYWLAR